MIQSGPVSRVFITRFPMAITVVLVPRTDRFFKQHFTRAFRALVRHFNGKRFAYSKGYYAAA